MTDDEPAKSPTDTSELHHPRGSGPGALVLARHIVVGLLIFAFFALATALLNFFIEKISRNLGLGWGMANCFKVLEYGLFLADSALLGRFTCAAFVHGWQAIEVPSRIGFYFEPLNKLKDRISLYFEDGSLRALVYFFGFTTLGISMGAALLFGNSWLPPGGSQVPKPLSSKGDPPIEPSTDKPIHPSQPAKAPIPRKSEPQPPISGYPTPPSPVVQDPPRPARPRPRPSIPASPRWPPVTEDNPRQQPAEPIAPGPSHPIVPIGHDPDSENEAKPSISFGGDSIRVYSRTSPSLVTKATFGALPPNFELRGMRLKVVVNIDEIGRGTVVSEVEFPSNFPPSPALRGRLSVQVRQFVERSRWRSARNGRGEQVSEAVSLVLILQ
jgi:hypothetical protein